MPSRPRSAPTRPKSAKKFEERGQLLPRDRVDLLLDRGTPVPRTLDARRLRMHDDDGAENASGGGVITGIGTVAGARVVVNASDSGIRGGAATPMGVDKSLRAQAIALENKLPYVQLVESAGANLLRQAEMFVRGGRTFANLAQPVEGRHSRRSPSSTALRRRAAPIKRASATMSSSCAAARKSSSPARRCSRPRPAKSRPTKTSAALSCTTKSPASPNTWPKTTATASASRAKSSPRSVGRKPQPKRTYKEPLYDAEELLSVVPLDYRKPYDVREVIARIVDGSDWLDFKPDYGPHTVCGHAAIEGHTVGIIGNNGPIDTAGSVKAAQFIQLCDQSGIPLLFLQNTTGYIVGTEAERGGIVKHGSKMIQAVTNAARAEDHAPYWRLIRRGKLRHVRTRLRSALHFRLAQQPHRGHGRRAGGQGDDHHRRRRRTPRRPRTRRKGARRRRQANHRHLRRRIRPPSTRPPACGTMASSTRATRAASSACASTSAKRPTNANCAQIRSASRGCDGKRGHEHDGKDLRRRRSFATLFQAALLSFIVGLVLRIFGIDPVDLWKEFGSTIQRRLDARLRRHQLGLAIRGPRRDRRAADLDHLPPGDGHRRARRA